MFNKKIYDSKGYVNIPYIMDKNSVFTFIVGFRGGGKTFGALKYAIDNNIKHILLRRSGTELDNIANDNASPYKALLSAYKEDKYIINFKAKKKTYEILQDDKLIGYGLALSTIASVRGLDFQDVKLIIFDEFIKESHVKPIKNEGQAFLNAYETINRNRELNGFDPLRVVFCANSNNLANPIFLEFGLVELIGKMIEIGDNYYYNKDKSIQIVLIDNNSPIARLKQKTALYKAVNSNSQYYKMAIDNKFIFDDLSLIKPHVNMKEYNYICKLGDICFYKHKNKNEYYATNFDKNKNNKNVYNATKDGVIEFLQKQVRIYKARLLNNVFFNKYSLQKEFDNLIKI